MVYTTVKCRFNLCDGSGYVTRVYGYLDPRSGEVYEGPEAEPCECQLDMVSSTESEPQVVPAEDLPF